MTFEIRDDPAALDADWMTVALEAGGVARGATVTELSTVGFIGTGQMGRNVRYRLTWDDPDGRPGTVVGKFPTDDPVGRATGFEANTYIKEWTFYREIRPTVSVRTPEVWVAEFDGEARKFVFIMEDMAQSAQGDQFAGLSAEQAGLGVEQAVAFHAPRWGDDRLLALTGETVEETAVKLQTLYDMTRDGTLARLGPMLDDDVVGFVQDFSPFAGRWAYGLDTPSTLAHMDYRPDNFLFATGPDAPPLAIVDWQTITYGLGTHDVAYMIGGGFEPADRAEVERPLVEDYARRMQAAGIDYDAETCWRDYRFSSIWGVIMSVIATMLAEQTERGDRMLSTMLRRHAHHAIDLEALDLVR